MILTLFVANAVPEICVCTTLQGSREGEYHGKLMISEAC